MEARSATPFTITSGLTTLSYPFPSHDSLRAALKYSTRPEREIFVSLWLAEGVPYAFRNCPALFEYIRFWLGRQLNVHPKEITLIGSARIGYSLAPATKFGREFCENSDLDFSVVSFALFERLAESARLFSSDYKSGVIVPRNERQGRMWSENCGFFDRNIPRGFLDSKKIPNRERYSSAQEINQSMSYLLRKLEATTEAPAVRDASVRVYRDWKSFVDQVSRNLRHALR